jgi:hypothetical protein
MRLLWTLLIAVSFLCWAIRCSQPAFQSRLEYLLSDQNRSILEHSAPIHKLLILPVDAVGLANRLRIISSVFSPSLFPNDRSTPDSTSSDSFTITPTTITVHLVVLWLADDACNAWFQDLFQLKGMDFLPTESVGDISIEEGIVSEWIDVTHWHGRKVAHRLSVVDCSGASSSQSFHSSVLKIYHRFQSSAPNRFWEHYPRYFFASLDHLYDEWSSTHLIWTRGTHSFTSLVDEYSLHKSQFYHTLQLVPVVQEVALSLRSSIFQKAAGSSIIWIGVHVRAFDTTQDWAMVSPFPSLSTTELVAESFDHVAPIDAFLQSMHQLLEHFETQATTPKVVKFFVVSNSQQAKKLLLSAFPSSRIVSLLSHHSETRSSLDALQFATLEFWLLGETDMILHTRGSSFAREAAMRHLIPVVDVSSLSFVLFKNLANDRCWSPFGRSDISSARQYGFFIPQSPSLSCYP